MTMVNTYLEYDTFINETVFFRSHYEIMRVVLVVDYVLQIDARLAVELLEEFLVEYKSYTADLLHASLRLGSLVYEVGRNRNGQLAPELLALEALQGVAFSVCSDENVELVLGYRVIGR